MTGRLTTVVGVVAMSVLLVAYLWAAGLQAWMMVTSGQPVVVLMGLALMIFPIVGLWALIRELRFGSQSSALARQLQSEGQFPVFDSARLPSGRIDRTRADDLFPQFAAAADASPEDWRSWFRLGLAYDASGDRRRARSAIRRAIALSRQPGGPHPAMPAK